MATTTKMLPHIAPHGLAAKHQQLAQAHLQDNPSLDVEGETCALCPTKARTYLPLRVEDPDAPGVERDVDLPLCAECFARVPRMRVKLPRDVATVVLQHVIDLEAYARDIVDARRAPFLQARTTKTR